MVEPTATWKPEWKRDTVYLHVFPRKMAKDVPNFSPFAVKIETWLRIHKIPYEVVDFYGMSAKTKQSPFIFFNEEEIADSNLLIEFLSKYFKINLYGDRSKEESAISLSFIKMMEENTVWPTFWYCYVKNMDEYREKGLILQGTPEAQIETAAMLTKSVEDRACKHGIGRHTDDEIYRIGSDDIRAVSDYLGDKKYMFGDNPQLGTSGSCRFNDPNIFYTNNQCEAVERLSGISVDCTLFGVMTQITDVDMNYPMKKVIQEECQNILKFVERMKTTYWLNWNEQ